MQAAFYDPYISYEKNYKQGPPVVLSRISPPKIKNKNKSYNFLGFKVNFPFGIPSGPLLNSKFIKAAFDFGFDVSTYKTIRSTYFPSHPFPNILYVKANAKLHPELTPRLIATNKIHSVKKVFNITNSFGVPSQEPQAWQEDVKKALKYEKNGQLLILSFMGTVKKDQTENEFIQDYVLASRLSHETGAKVLEANLSCPNIGNEGLVCYNLNTTEKVSKAIRNTIGNTPLILKVGYFKSNKDLELLAKIANEYANAIAAINTLQVEVVDKKGNQALPGKMRLKSGVCGSCIKWAGLEMVKRLNKIRRKNNYKFSIVGIGGVMNSNDYLEYRNNGADLVQSATGAIWNPYLASQIKEEVAS